MPTARPRHMVTETDRLAAAIDLAAESWPALAGERAQLLRKIIELGVNAVEASAAADRQQRLAAIAAIAGSAGAVWPSDWREELRGDWPA